MMPDLGKYAFAVLGSWGVTLVLLGGLCALTIVQGARMRRALAEAEARMGKARAAEQAAGQAENGK